MKAKNGKYSNRNQTVNFFTNLLLKHPAGYKALNWGSRNSQELRFQILAEMGFSKGASVLDIGCGLGDFYFWQKRQGLELKYRGIDITPSMINAAQKKFSHVQFKVADLLENETCRYDYIIASGLFYLQKKKPQDYLENTVERLFKSCRKGLAFNSLSNWSNKQTPREFYADPLSTIKFCRSLSPFVVLRHDYHLNDFTIYIRRSRKTL